MTTFDSKLWQLDNPVGYEFEIPGVLPSLNQYVRVSRGNKFAANKFKQDTEAAILPYLHGAPKYMQPVVVEFIWIRPDMRTDKDNVAFAKKFILDALQKAGVISSDSWKQCTPYDRRFSIEPANPRTIVRISIKEHSIC